MCSDASFETLYITNVNEGVLSVFAAFPALSIQTIAQTASTIFDPFRLGFYNVQ